jgi:hypothetical protein
MSRLLVLTSVLAGALAFTAPAAALNLFDDIGDNRSMGCETHAKDRYAAACDPARHERGRAPRQAYDWPDQRYYGHHGMMSD